MTVYMTVETNSNRFGNRTDEKNWPVLLAYKATLYDNVPIYVYIYRVSVKFDAFFINLIEPFSNRFSYAVHL